MNLFKELMILVEKLNEADLPYALCGGVAVTLHGFVRATDDIDLLVPPAYIPLVKKVAHTVGFRVQNTDPMVFGRGKPREAIVHRVSKYEGEEALILDLMEVNDANRSAWKSRRAHKVSGTVIWAIGRKPLMAMKKESARPKDLIDIQGLEGKLEN
jgi:hypothetical protein